MSKRYQAPPIIIKVIKKNDGDHRNMAWKIAYADFVTAMMAFFLLLWLYAMLSPKQKVDIADYFAPTIGVVSGEGIGVKGGKIEAEMGTSTSETSREGIVQSQLQYGPSPRTSEQSLLEGENESSAMAGDTETVIRKKTFMAIADAIARLVEPTPAMENNLMVEKTDDTLKINLVNDPNQLMFLPARATFTPSGKKQLASIAGILAKADRKVSIISYTAADKNMDNPQYSNWELSMERANAVRRLLVEKGLRDACVNHVAGLAHNELLIPTEPNNPRNNRVTINIHNGDC
jgi:chemotaxis protein MotB